MTAKTTPISVRITPQDAEFLATLKIDEAVTPSEKIRALLRQAREGEVRERELSTSRGMARGVLEPILEQVKLVELEKETHSELVALLGEWLTDLLAFLATQVPEEVELDVEALEAALTQRVFRLFAAVARLGITREAPCYDPTVIERHLPPLFEVLDIIRTRIETNKK